MSTSFESTQRFLRPTDVARLRRNHRRVQAQRLLVIARNGIIVVGLVLAGAWAYRQTQSDARFAVRHIGVLGAVHTPRAEVDAITQRYVGLNLFKIDIARVQRDLGSLPWIARIDIEKNLPDTLRIKIVERTPVALVQGDGPDGRLTYVDDQGVAFAQLSPTVGDDDLPVISGASGEELVRTVALISRLRAHDPQLFARISEVRPVAPRGFALFDRELGAFVYANGDDLSEKVRRLDAIVRAERFTTGSVEYADLRFDDRIILKPIHPIAVTAPKPRSMPAVAITN
jgi:cell division protein FtsQ